jgi:hypothetical protein
MTQMQEILADPLVGLVEGRFHEALANGADVRELAAAAVDVVMGEAVQLLEQHAAGLTAGMGRLTPYTQAWLHERAMRDGALDCAERLMAAQFGGYIPAQTRR